MRIWSETILWELSLTLFTGFHKSHNPYSQVVTMIQMSWLEKAECVCRDWTVSSARCVSESTVVSTAKHLQSVNQSFPVFRFLILNGNMENKLFSLFEVKTDDKKTVTKDKCVWCLDLISITYSSSSLTALAKHHLPCRRLRSYTVMQSAKDKVWADRQVHMEPHWRLGWKTTSHSAGRPWRPVVLVEQL